MNKRNVQNLKYEKYSVGFPSIGYYKLLRRLVTLFINLILNNIRQKTL